MRRIKELDGLRALAILVVIPCHYTAFAGLAGKLPEFGWVGVDIFFALSGYLITTILLGLREKESAYKTFYSRRAIRIFPPYLATLALIIFFGVIGRHFFVLAPKYLLRQLLFFQAYSPGTRRFALSLLRHPLWHLTHLPPLGLHAHHLPEGWQGLWPSLNSADGPFWSLSIEEYFYLLWAPVVLRCSRRSIAIIGIVVCLVEILLRWMSADWLAYFNLFTRFDALLYGAFLALLLERWRHTSPPAWARTFFTSIFALAVLTMAIVLAAIHPILGREIRQSPLVLVVGVPALGIAATSLIGLLVLRADSRWWLARLFRTRPFQYIGTISYTMYLVHLLAGYIIWQVAKTAHRSGDFVLLQNIAALILTIVMARISWHFLEKPLLRWKDRRFPSSPHPPEPALN